MAKARSARVKPDPPPLKGAEVHEWTEEQTAVIESSPSERTLVSAGPGTGKTAVACARIAHLITDCQVEPGRIWLVSFTRTAVHELRTRIGRYVGDAGKAAGLRIATIDSHAWAIQSGFNSDASLTGSFDDNIERLIEMIKTHQGVFEYLSDVRHLLIDEAQDVIGSRCLLMLELIHALPADCGVTVLADDAQSIYGFTGEDTEETGDGTLPEAVRAHLQFEELHLTEIHRTKDEKLKRLFTEGRGIVLKGKLEGRARLDTIRDFLIGTNHGDAGQFQNDIKSLPPELDDAFLLFRKRGEAFTASSYLETRPHRLRMSGLPVAIHAWISRILWDWTTAEMDRSEFERRWSDRIADCPPDAVIDAWGTLVRICGVSKGRISTRNLASRLARGAPPMELCSPDFGPGGPFVGTIHASKGREAGEVRLYLPPPSSEKVQDEKAEEEARVLFVGATRARYDLKIGQGPTQVYAQATESGRAYTPYLYPRGQSRACVEIGRVRDIDAPGLGGKDLFSSAKEVAAAQAHIAGWAVGIHKTVAHGTSAAEEWRYAVYDESNPDTPTKAFFFSTHVNNDFWEIGKKVAAKMGSAKRKPPRGIPHLRTFGVRTLAVAPDDPVRERLHAPWRDSGFMLAPLVLGYGMVYFGYMRQS